VLTCVCLERQASGKKVLRVMGVTFALEAYRIGKNVSVGAGPEGVLKRGMFEDNGEMINRKHY